MSLLISRWVHATRLWNASAASVKTVTEKGALSSLGKARDGNNGVSKEGHAVDKSLISEETTIRGLRKPSRTVRNLMKFVSDEGSPKLEPGFNPGRMRLSSLFPNEISNSKGHANDIVSLFNDFHIGKQTAPHESCFHLNSKQTGVSHTSIRTYSTLLQDHLKGPHKKFRPPRKPLGGKPMLRGVVLKTLIKKPKKPNSANRKCVLVRLTNGKEAVAYVPGIGHNLQEHNVVLVRCGRLQDVPGVKLKCIRGKYDLPHVIKPPKP